MKHKLLISVVALATVLMVPLSVRAEINGAEQRILNTISGTFTYEGKTYKVKDSYQAQVRAKLDSDGVNMTDDEASSYIDMFYSNIGMGVASGYMEEVGGSEVAPEPQSQPTAEPTVEPTVVPTVEPVPEPTIKPTSETVSDTDKDVQQSEISSPSVENKDTSSDVKDEDNKESIDNDAVSDEDNHKDVNVNDDESRLSEDGASNEKTGQDIEDNKDSESIISEEEISVIEDTDKAISEDNIQDEITVPEKDNKWLIFAGVAIVALIGIICVIRVASYKGDDK